ncbi:recombinase family protein [Streptomyces sp. NPDC004284]|uniref:recombinase family protein n=1 Tax=Streptomyces sp. NPDC004284 TaxID=3364695 RepID=UPI003679FD52
MTNLVDKRVSTDQQSTARQNVVLDEAGIEAPVVIEEAPGTSSSLHPLQRPKFRELLTYARPGDTVHISEMFRLVRGSHIPAVHRQLLAHCQPLDGAQGLPAVPARRKARREYENRVSALTP